MILSSSLLGWLWLYHPTESRKSCFLPLAAASPAHLPPPPPFLFSPPSPKTSILSQSTYSQLSLSLIPERDKSSCDSPSVLVCSLEHLRFHLRDLQDDVLCLVVVRLQVVNRHLGELLPESREFVHPEKKKRTKGI